MQKGHWSGHDTKQRILQSLFKHEYNEDDIASTFENFGLPEFDESVASMHNSILLTEMVDQYDEQGKRIKNESIDAAKQRQL